MSDVSGSLFSIGKPKQVEDYVKKLIDKLRIDRGHILGSVEKHPLTANQKILGPIFIRVKLINY